MAENKIQRAGLLLFATMVVAVVGAGAYVFGSGPSLTEWFDEVVVGTAPDQPAAPVVPTPPPPVTPPPAAVPAQVPVPAPQPATPAPAEQAPIELPVLMPVEDDAEPAEWPEDVLLDAVERGDLRLGTYGDVLRWHARHRARVPGASNALPDHFEHLDVYIVKRPFRIPPGLAGADAVVFIVPEGAPFPKGDPGHSPVLDMESGACRGAICMLMRRD